MIRVFIGTKAQYIKTAPLIRLMDDRNVPYRLIDSGQHGAFSAALRDDLAIREPDVFVGGDKDIASIPAAIVWSAKLWLRSFDTSYLVDEVFGPEPGICVVQGDTPSTLLAAVMARRAGLGVAQLEAGLRSFNIFNPFPEELVRMFVMRRADYLFAENQAAMDLLDDLGLADRGVLLPANTIVEAAVHAVGGTLPEPASGPAIATLHRVEAIKSRQRSEGFAEVVLKAAERWPIVFVMHPPTEDAFTRYGILDRFRERGVTIKPLLPHREFAPLVAAAPFVVTDGGSIQEECSLFGIPTLLWRGATERPQDLERNAILSEYSVAKGLDFLSTHEHLRQPLNGIGLKPSEVVLDTLLGAEAGRAA